MTVIVDCDVVVMIWDFLMQVNLSDNGKRNENECIEFINNDSGFSGIRFDFGQLRQTKDKNP